MEIGRASCFRVRFDVKFVVAEVASLGLLLGCLIKLAQGYEVVLGCELVLRDGQWAARALC